MAYEALARKYRPRTFSEVVGQKPIVRTLTNAIGAKRIHHAYVFSGVRGVGKTTIARIFAKALNCEKGPTSEPCLVCSPCVEITAGQDIDVIEMDAATRTGVDDVRDLIDTTRYAPARDRYKVFIIDEFHMLSRPAFNALLKTLEEPPPRIVFVMATTELHKVPSTVLSRTQQFDFRKVSLGEIVELLESIARKESIQAPRACLEMLARAADGSVRDAESLLDQAIASCGNQLDEDALRALLGLVPDETVEAFFTAAAERDAGALVRLIDAVVSEGHDLRVFLGGLIEGGRRLLVLRTVESPSEILGLAKEHEVRLKTLSDGFEPLSLLRMLTALIELEEPLKQSEQPRYLLEAAAIRIAAIADLAPIEELIARLDAGGPEPPRPSAPPPGRGAPSHAPPRGPAPSAPSPSAASGVAGKRPSSSRTSSSSSAPSDPAGGTPERAALGADPRREAERSTFLDLLHERKVSLAMLVEKAVSVTVAQDRVTLLFDDSGSFARKSVEQAANLALLGDLASTALGRTVAIDVARAPKAAASAAPAPHAGPAGRTSEDGENGDRHRAHTLVPDAEAPVIAPEEAADPDTDPDADAEPTLFETAPVRPDPEVAVAPVPVPDPAVDAPISEARRQRLLAEAHEDPIVRKIVERFEGRIVEVKEVQ